MPKIFKVVYQKTQNLEYSEMDVLSSLVVSQHLSPRYYERLPPRWFTSAFASLYPAAIVQILLKSRAYVNSQQIKEKGLVVK